MVARPTRKRMYRTMQGRMVDIEKLRASNEHVRAVGIMNVNARGDVLGPSGRIIESKADVIILLVNGSDDDIQEIYQKNLPIGAKSNSNKLPLINFLYLQDHVYYLEKFQLKNVFQD